MGSLCLSAAAILRCESFTKIQNQVLIIPVALELVFATTLVFTNWKSDRRYLFLTGASWIYLSEALLELLSHTLPAVRDSLRIFQPVDITLAATSFIPILLYTLFVFLFTRAELLDTLPRRLQGIATLLLAIFIPSIIALNEVASFVGISRRVLTLNGRPTVAIGFSSDADQNLWTFFTSLTLALLTAFQAINFCFAFFRVVKALLSQRNIETTSSDRAHLFRGIAWIAGGLKLGAIETVVGFAQGSFGIALTRRILHFLSRACLCIGIVKGVDSVVDFAEVNDEMTGKKQFRRSQLKQMVSNPRFSTFQQLSPSATTFHATPRAPRGTEGAGPRTLDGLAGMSQFALMRDKSRQRVTVHYQDGAPTLHMRFSALDLPSPTTIVESIKSRPQSEWGSLSRRASSYYPNSVDNVIPEIPSRTPIYARHTRAYSDFSLRSYPDSISAVHDLATQFPGLPPRITGVTKPPPWDPYASYDGKLPLDRANSSASRVSNPTSTLSASNSLSRRKPVPRLSDNIDPLDDAVGEEAHVVHLSLPLSVGGDRTSGYVPHDPVTQAGYKIGLSPSSSVSYTPMTTASGFTQPAGTPQSDPTTPGNEDPFLFDGYPSTLHSSKSSDLKQVLATRNSNFELTSVQKFDYAGVTMSTAFDGTIDRIKQTVPPMRIKSVGKAPRRFTPTPVKTGLTRGSIYIEPIMIPPKQTGMPVAIQEGSVPSNYGGALRDSEVLGVEEDDLFVRAR